MNFDFDRTSNEDLVVSVDGSSHNFGYHYDSCFPLMFWLAHRQLGLGNILRGMQIPTFCEGGSRERDFESLVSSVLSFSDSLPLPSNDDFLRGFFMDTELNPYFTSGSNRVSYTFRFVDGTQNVHLDRSSLRGGGWSPREEALVLNPEDAKGFLSSYLPFVSRRNDRTNANMHYAIPLLLEKE